MKKDSCVEFHMGKENIVTGKTEDVDSMRNNKVSIVNTSTPVRKPKVSQFCVQHKWLIIFPIKYTKYSGINI